MTQAQLRRAIRDKRAEIDQKLREAMTLAEHAEALTKQLKRAKRCESDRLEARA